MKKIMFNDKFGLTQAVLEGRKTMTRRIIHDKDILRFGHNKHSDKSDVLINLAAPYKIGEIVAVAQSYHSLNKSGYLAPEWLDHTCEDSAGYENKMFVDADLMPHRIRITCIKVERLQDITEEDCLKEGIERNMYGDGFHIHYKTPSGRYLYLGGSEAWQAFAKLIDRISGKGTWERNPWVFAYSFELID